MATGTSSTPTGKFTAAKRIGRSWCDDEIDDRTRCNTGDGTLRSHIGRINSSLVAQSGARTRPPGEPITPNRARCRVGRSRRAAVSVCSRGRQGSVPSSGYTRARARTDFRRVRHPPCGTDRRRAPQIVRGERVDAAAARATSQSTFAAIAVPPHPAVLVDRQTPCPRRCRRGVHASMGALSPVLSMTGFPAMFSRADRLADTSSVW